MGSQLASRGAVNENRTICNYEAITYDQLEQPNLRPTLPREVDGKTVRGACQEVSADNLNVFCCQLGCCLTELCVKF